MDHDGMMRSLADRILAADIATLPVAMLPGTMPLDEAWAQCRSEALDFDVVLVAVASGQSHVARREPSWQSSDLRLSTVSYPLPRDMVLEGDASLWKAVDLIMDQGVAFCMTSGGIGIVSPADLNKPVCALWILGRILDFEKALTDLFPSITSRTWKAGRADSWIEGVSAEVERRKLDGTYLTEEDCLTFAQKLAISREWLRDTFPPDGKDRMSGSLFKSSFGWLSRIRNDLAHGRSPRHGRGGPLELLRRLDRLDDYTARLWALVADREDVWDRYAESELSVLTDGVTTPVWQARDSIPENCWMVSAMNPFERVLPDTINSSRHDALRADAKRRGIYICDGMGSAPQSGGWSESMVVVGDSNRETAVELSRWYGQRSVFELAREHLHVIEVETGEVRRTVSFMRA